MHSNRLIQEKSPYLQQHAHNPVDWYPWGPEAFDKAAREKKPIFLSIGYSTCHWCHVMERESFEDPAVARLMNAAFVAIKVDREERPDIDQVYMAVCQMMTGSGGWPLTILMTPEKNPFFAGTYLPKANLFGRIGMLDLIPRIQAMWLTRRGELIASADNLTRALHEASSAPPGQELDASTLHKAYEQLAQRFDERYGGFGEAPKFPAPHHFLFLLRHWKRTGDKHSLRMVQETLDKMRAGGIYDQIGFGFHRYATDREWLAPHFEKMLYDQALLIMAYAETGAATGAKRYEQTAREICAYVLRDMTAPDGGFYSAEDADSEGQEGKFYIWTEEQIRRVLEADEADLAVKVYSVKENGNFREEATGMPSGANILHIAAPLAQIAASLGMTEEALCARLAMIRPKLFAVRRERIHPGKDDKILTDWNGLMIAALAKASRAFDEPDFAAAAVRAADFILGNMRRSDGRLLHRCRDGEATITAHLDDYAFMIWGLIELYETTFETQRLQLALELNNHLWKHFWDREKGGFYFTADDAEVLPVRRKEIYDGALPSGNSVAMLNLLRLGKMSGNAEFEKQAAAVGRAFSANVTQFPAGSTFLMTALDFAVGPAYEVVVAGDSQTTGVKDMLRALGKAFIPNAVALLRRGEQDPPDIVRIADFTRNQPGIAGKATAYVCVNYACRAPTTDINEMLNQLGGRAAAKER